MGRTGTEAGQKCPAKMEHKQRVNLKKSFTRKTTYKLPKGLVGSKCTATIMIAGSECNCILDSGSQVTTVSESFHKNNFPDKDIKPLHDLLEIEGAAGQSVPYLGYIDMTVTFPKDFLEVDIEIPTLALVVPDVHPDSQTPVLIGTNTLDVLYEQYQDLKSPDYLPGPYGLKAVLYTLQLRHKQNKDGKVGLVTLLGKNAAIIPSSHTVVLEGAAKAHHSSADKCAIIEHPSQSSLPGGLCVKSCLITLPARAPYKVPVVITNETE